MVKINMDNIIKTDEFKSSIRYEISQLCSNYNANYVSDVGKLNPATKSVYFLTHQVINHLSFNIKLKYLNYEF